VFTGSPFHLHAYAQSLGTTNELLLGCVFGRYDADPDHPWHRLERGEGTLAEALEHAQEACRAAGIDGFEAEEFFMAMASTDSQARRELVVGKVRELNGRGIRQAIITNNAKEFSDRWRSLITLDELFEAVFDSSTEGTRKPEPAIYLRAMQRLEVSAPAASVFLDDFGPNVDAAAALGMHGILVGEDMSAALGELDRIIAVESDAPR